MSSPPPPNRSAADTTPIPDDDQEPDLPLTMTASVVLTSLPRDARAGLATAGAFEKEKGTSKLMFPYLHMNFSAAVISTCSKLLLTPGPAVNSSHILQGSWLRASAQETGLNCYCDSAIRSCRLVSAKSLEVQAPG